jgi:hypothetical protein
MENALGMNQQDDLQTTGVKMAARSPLANLYEIAI